jgi:streptogramin lyase
VAVPEKSQGAAFDAAGRLWLTRSGGTFGELVSIDLASGAVTARYAMPAGIEDISFDDDGQLWAVSEAGSARWSGWPTFFPMVFRLDLKKLR